MTLDHKLFSNRFEPRIDWEMLFAFRIVSTRTKKNVILKPLTTPPTTKKNNCTKTPHSFGKEKKIQILENKVEKMF